MGKPLFKILTTLLFATNLFAKPPLQTHSKAVEAVHTRYYSGEFEYNTQDQPIKKFMQALQTIENNISLDYSKNSVEYLYLKLLIALVMCDIAHLSTSKSESELIIAKVTQTYEHGTQIQASPEVHPDYWRALGELALKLTIHDPLSAYFYTVNGKRYLDKALAIHPDNINLIIPFIIFHIKGVSNLTFNKIRITTNYLKIADQLPLNSRQNFIKEMAKSSLLVRTRKRLEGIAALKEALKIFPNSQLVPEAIEAIKQGNSFF
ncbi:hypothetical protein CR532_04860 (plasmid) [Candidatus Borreliella tachyglossi]|uniref:Uncharacterized protein n=2 Tax=Candidatus Borreliella tachyglossi TaxID=1964448 RepID=A0A2S1LYJ0_9SPIR|nr:hypothetical protein CR532_04860 [Candidatus Borreliella tachyglossi]